MACNQRSPEGLLKREAAPDHVHLFPLPYHTWAFHVAQSANIVAAHNQSAVWQWMDVAFANQESFFAEDLNDSNMAALLESMAKASAMLPAGAMIKGLANQELNWATRVSWKYGCSRSIAGTPSYLVNGVAVAASTSWSLAEWKQVLDPLVSALPPPDAAAVAARRAGNKSSCAAGTTDCVFLPGKHECCTKGEFCIPNVGCRC